jgi:hypothetical protein
MSGYYNPPDEIRQIGRKLLADSSFASLLRQMSIDEVLVGIYYNPVPALVAAHIY